MRAQLVAISLTLCTVAAAQEFDLHATESLHWFRGNTHTHTLWSDGEAAPEYAVKWYKDQGYQFLCLSDHNILSDGSVERWAGIGGDSKLTPAQVAELQMIFGPDAVQLRKGESGDEMRLKTLPEVRQQFEEQGKFLLIQAEEITCMTPKVHVCAVNVRDVIRPLNSSAAEKSMSHAFEAIAAQEQQYQQPIAGHLNHPNWNEGVPVQSIVPTGIVGFFEVFNGHPGVRNWGDPGKGMVSTDRIWDIVLSMRLHEDPASRFYGFASDDTHDYFRTGPKECNPGRGWVMVLAEKLDANTITQALKDARFYSTSGVLLNGVSAGGGKYRVEIAAEEGVTYTTQFIGTRKDFDPTVQPAVGEDGQPIPGGSSRYSDSIGVVLAETTTNPAEYTPSGDELYVRAKIISSRDKANGFMPGDKETAWTQPWVLAK